MVFQLKLPGRQANRQTNKHTHVQTRCHYDALLRANLQTERIDGSLSS